MKNYAKFCKLNIKGKTYQLNLTEGGFDGSNFIDKTFSILRYLAPVLSIYSFAKFGFLFNVGTFATNLLSWGILGLILSATTLFSHTTFGNIFNSIQKNYNYINKIKKFYKDMRDLEKYKNKYKIFKVNKYVDKQQAKIANKLMKYFLKQTCRNQKLSKKYYKIKDKNGYVDGLKGIAFENLETCQETIDKFLFHNAKLLICLCPDFKEFICSRAKVRVENIVTGEPYYDEFVWSALENEMIVKNNCLNKKDSSNYIENLGKFLTLTKKEENIEFETLENPQRTLENPRETLNKNNENLLEDEQVKQNKLEKQNLNIYDDNKKQTNIKEYPGSFENIYKTR